MSDEALRRSDELLAELTELVETARALPMSTSCVLPRERVLDMLDDLREALPPEINEARRVLATRERMFDEARELTTQSRERALAQADAVLSDATHQADQIVANAEHEAHETVAAGKAEHARLVSNTAVHQAADVAATALREEAERYQAQVTADADQYDTRVRAEADRYAHDARTEAERYATKLTADAEDYAERTLSELTGVLQRAASTAEQGRAAIASRRASAWVDGSTGEMPFDVAEYDDRPSMTA